MFVRLLFNRVSQYCAINVSSNSNVVGRLFHSAQPVKPVKDWQSVIRTMSLNSGDNAAKKKPAADKQSSKDLKGDKSPQTKRQRMNKSKIGENRLKMNAAKEAKTKTGVNAQSEGNQQQQQASSADDWRQQQINELDPKIQTLLKVTSALTSTVEASIHVVQSGCVGHGKSFLLWCTNSSYLFNCPEGSVRMLNEQNQCTNRLEHVFLTGASWARSGGLPGLGLTLQACGLDRFTIHGPPQVQHVLDAVRPYSDQKLQIDPHVNNNELVENRLFNDKVIQVETIVLQIQKQTADAQTDHCPMDSTGEHDSKGLVQFPAMEGMQLKPGVQHRMNGADSDQPHLDSVSVFHVQILPKPPKVDVKKCMQLKVPFGPMIGQLQAGQTITLDDGRQIEPASVVEPQLPAERFLVVDCPNEDFFNCLLENKRIQSIIAGDFNDEGNVQSSPLDLVIHMSPANVFESTAYNKWMTDCWGPATKSSGCKHLMLNERAPYLSHSYGICKQQRLHHHIHPSIFPKFSFDRDQQQEQSECAQSHQEHSTNTHERLSTKVNDKIDDSVQECLAEPWMQFYVRGVLKQDKSIPSKAFIRAEQVPLPVESKRFEDPIAALTDQAQTYIDNVFKQEVSEESCLPPLYPIVNFLGTSSASANKYRSMTGILVQVSPDSSVLLDCGEGTFLQMMHLFGPTTIGHVLRSIKFIFLSHMHQDHYLGVFEVLLQRQKAFRDIGVCDVPPVHMLASAPLFSICNLYSADIESLGKYAITIPTKNPPMALLADAAAASELRSIQAVKVHHAMMAYGIVLVTDKGKKIVFSGDTRPCEGLIEAGKDCDLLIHEATHEDALNREALRSQHSTISQAVQVATNMRARHTVLTHFSARYHKVPLLPDEPSVLAGKSIGIAYDFMRLGTNHCDCLSGLWKVFNQVYAEEYEKLDQRKDSRIFKRKLDQEVKQDKQLGGGMAAAKVLEVLK